MEDGDCSFRRNSLESEKKPSILTPLITSFQPMISSVEIQEVPSLMFKEKLLD